MDQEKKIKIILISVFAILLLGVGYLFLGHKSGGDDGEVSVRAIDSAEVSISDIMQQGEKAPSGSYSPTPDPSIASEMPITSSPTTPPTEEYESSEDISKLQQQLRENLKTQRSENTQAGYITPSYTNNRPAPREETKTYEAPASTTPTPAPVESEQPTAITDEQASKKHSRFNSGMRRKANEIRVLVLGEQELRNDAPLKMVLAQSIILEGTSIPKGTALYGIVHTGNGRMNVSVSSIRYRDHSYSVSFSVYDRDGLKGINIHEPERRENTAQEVAEDVAQRTGIISGTVGAITSTISGVFRRKGSSSTIIIKSNYQLSLR